jgi:site-specific DNA recombinase
VYARVSTANQVHQQTIEQQLDRLRSHLQAQGATLDDSLVFRDDGYSGAQLNRPGLDRLRDAVRERRIDRLLLTAPDRLARNYVHQMVLLEEFEQQGCQVDFLDRPMSQDPHDQLLLQIRGAVAEYERTLIAERMRRGRLAKLRAGVLLPWTRPPYGYRLHPDRPRDPGGVTLEPAEAAVVAEIFALYLEPGASLLRVARALRQRQIRSPTGKPVWGIATLRGILRNPSYTGQVHAGRMRSRPPRIRRSATHPIGRPHDSRTPVPPEEWIPVAAIPAIVAQAQFDLARSKLSQNQSFATRNNTAHPYLLRALVSCGHCLRACIGRTQAHSPYAYYVCSGKAKAADAGREPCPSRFIPAAQLDGLVWQDLCEILAHPESLKQALERTRGGHWLPQELLARRENLRKGRAALGQQLDRLTEAYLQGVIPLPEYERRRRELEQRGQALAEQEAQLCAQAGRQEAVAGLGLGIDDFCARVRIGLDNASFDQKRQLLELLVDRVVVTDTDVEIRYAIPTHPRSEHVRFCHLRTDYFGAPHLVAAVDGQPAQQVRVDLVLRVRLAGVGPLVNRLQPHCPQQPPGPLGVDFVPQAAQVGRHPQHTVARRPRVLLVQQAHQREVLRAFARRAVVQAGAVQAQQLALPADAEPRVLRIDQPPPRGYGLACDFFFSQSRSATSCPICRCSSSTSPCWPACAFSRLPENASGIAASACFFHRLTWVAWTPYSAVSSLAVFCCRMASTATFALNSAVCLLRTFAMFRLAS